MPTSANSYGPYDAGAGSNITENFWRLMARWFAQVAVVGNYLNELAPFGDSTGLQAKVNTGGAIIRGAYGEWTGTTTQGLAAVGGIAGGSERWDRLVVRNDFVNNLMQIDVLTGTASASPSAVRPALTQTSSMWEYLLADVGPLINTTTTVTAAMVLDGRWKISETGILYYEVAPGAVASTVIPAAGTIPATARVLEVDWQLLTTSGSTFDFLLLRLNGDTGSNYNYAESTVGAATYSGTGQVLLATSARVGTVPGTGGNPASGATRLWYPRNATSLKTISSDTVRADGGSGVYTGHFGAQWLSSAAAVNQLTFLLSAGNFSQASFIAQCLP